MKKMKLSKKIYILLSALFILILFVFLMYLQGYLKYSSFKFNTADTSSKYTYVTMNELPINLDIQFYSKKEPVLDSNKAVISKGEYAFTVSYSQIGDKAPTNVNLMILLHCDWIENYNYNASTTVPNKAPTTPGQFKIATEQKLPQNPLPFVSVKYPTMYIQVKITIDGEVITKYVKNTKIMRSNVAIID